jgi:hypothetical protein
VLITFVVSISLSFDIYYIAYDSLFMFYLLESRDRAVRAEDEGDGVYDINKVGLDDADAAGWKGGGRDGTRLVASSHNDFYSSASLRNFFEGTRRRGKKILVDDLHNDVFFNHGYGVSMLNENNSGADVEYRLLTPRRGNIVDPC